VILLDPEHRHREVVGVLREAHRRVDADVDVEVVRAVVALQVLQRRLAGLDVGVAGTQYFSQSPCSAMPWKASNAARNSWRNMIGW
jgi:hypothetical protein